MTVAIVVSARPVYTAACTATRSPSVKLLGYFVVLYVVSFVVSTPFVVIATVLAGALTKLAARRRICSQVSVEISFAVAGSTGLFDLYGGTAGPDAGPGPLDPVAGEGARSPD